MLASLSTEEPVLFHSGIFHEVRGSLALQRAAFVADQRADDAAQVPPTLFYSTDAAGLRGVIAGRALPAVLSGMSSMHAEIDAGMARLRSFVTDRLARHTDAGRRFFCEEVLAYLQRIALGNAAGYESFVLRLHAGGANAAGYRLGLSTASLEVRGDASAAGGALRLARAIYSRAQQQSLLERWCAACEDSYVDALALFGAERHDSFLATCWDAFLQVAMELVVLYRDPERAAEQEWVATLLDLRPLSERANDNVQYALAANALVPYVSLPLRAQGETPGLCLQQILVDAALTGPAATAGVSAFLRHHGLFGVQVFTEGSTA
jgi:hypothetical protein